MRPRSAWSVSLATGLLLSALAPSALGASPAAVGKASWKDIDGDGRADLVVGIPGEDVSGVKDAGAVEVIYGSANGLHSAGSQRVSQATAGVADDPEAGDHFGFAVAQGDFNGDGFGDVAVGVPGEDNHADKDAGGVNILYGSKQGLKGDARQHLLVASTNDTRRVGARFGSALAALDTASEHDLPISAQVYGRAHRATAWLVRDGVDAAPASTDGIADLAVGAPGYDDGSGMAIILALGALDPDGGFGLGILVQPTVPAGTHLGASVAGGDFDDQGSDDLAVGMPGWSTQTLVAGGFPVSGAGAVLVMMNGQPHGSDLGLYLLLWRGHYLPQVAGPDDHVGASVAAGDLDGDGFDDLMIGAPGADPSQDGNGQPVDFPGAGEVFMVFSHNDGSGLETDPSLVVPLYESFEGVPGPIHGGDHFGASVAVGKVSATTPGVVVGIPGAKVIGAAKAGAVDVIFGLSMGPGGVIPLLPNRRLTQATSGIAGTPGNGDAFGNHLAIANYDGSGPRDLAISAAGEIVGGHAQAGLVEVLYGGEQGPKVGGSQAWTQDSSGVPGTPANGDHFGGGL